MQQQFEAQNHIDQEGRPAGGFVRSVGLSIEWQRGPLGRGRERLEPNGAFVETVIAAAKQRLAHFQTSRFACDENRDARSGGNGRGWRAPTTDVEFGCAASGPEAVASGRGMNGANFG
jgi:hypothetical protein